MFPDADRVAAFVGPLARAAEPWRTLYSDSALVSTSVLFLHLGALVASAGVAVATDRAVIRTAGSDPSALMGRLDELSSSHRSVIMALIVSFVSGVLLLLADIEAFVVMVAFWIKMTLIAMLLANALLMHRQERRIRALAYGGTLKQDGVQQVQPVTPERSWARLRRHAWTSMTLWFAIVLAGTAMTTT
jgi:amino acid transporter